MEWMMSYFEAMKSQLVSEVSKQITDIVIGSIQEGLSKMDEACEQQAIRTVKFAAKEIAKEKEERKLDIKEAISQNRIENLTHMRDENELRNSIFIKGASSKEEATEAIKVITDNPEVVVLSIEIVSKGRGYREHRSNESKGVSPANEITEASADPKNQEGTENEGTDGANPSNEINQFHGARIKLNQEMFELVMKNKKKLNENSDFKHLFVDKAQTREEGQIKRKLREEIRNTLANADEDGKLTFNGKTYNKNNGKLTINRNFKIIFINNKTQ